MFVNCFLYRIILDHSIIPIFYIFQTGKTQPFKLYSTLILKETKTKLECIMPFFRVCYSNDIPYMHLKINV